MHTGPSMTDLSPATILIVDDAEANIDILLEVLGQDYEIRVSTDGEKALALVKSNPPDLILLDVMMPQIDGYETCRRLKSDRNTMDIPVIFITGQTETKDIIKGFRVGGVDYITKPFHPEEVCARVRTHLELQFLRRKNEERLKATMTRYLGTDVVNALMESGDVVMGTRSHEVTILFSDIRNFTGISEAMEAQETVAFLNEYFSWMVTCIQAEKGMLDKFIGDEIMAVFGALVLLKDHADCSVRAAIAMMKALKKYNEKREAKSEKPVDMGIGLNSSTVVLGNIGSSDRMDYTVIGDGVNTAARIEEACKLYGAHILISEFTYQRLSGDYQIRELDRVYLKGKSKPLRIYEILDYHTEETFPNRNETLKWFTEGREELQGGHWGKALLAFEEALRMNPNDQGSKIHAERCQRMIANPPAGAWEGIWELKSN